MTELHTEFLEFEENIAVLENKIDELKKLSGNDHLNITEEIIKLQKKADALLKKTYSQLTPWQKVQVARHPQRPKYFDYLQALFTNFVELSGDKKFAEDKAIIGGLAEFDGIPCVVLGIQKGYNTESRLVHNFGMPKPEGYRKAIRLMDLADRFNLPVITFIDTSGAYPGIDAEARGQAEAIAASIQKCLQITVPILSVVIGEGFSGGAIGIGTADRIFLLEHSVFTVISPEGCASILWKDIAKSTQAAQALKLTAQDLEEHKMIDVIIPEPLGGAHRDPEKIIKTVHHTLAKHLRTLLKVDRNKILKERHDKYLKLGQI